MPLYGEQDAAYARRIEAERNRLTGPTATYYQLLRGRNVDPLYNEPVTWEFTKFEVVVSVEWEERDNREFEAEEEGSHAEVDAIARVARNAWEKVSTTRPKEGDVIYFHERYWDVIKANEGSRMLDTSNFVGYQMELRKRSRFDPERRVKKGSFDVAVGIEGKTC